MMKTSFSLRIIIPIAIFFSLVTYSYGQSVVNERAKWFVDARFGMFIHWGVYSGAEGVWKGEVLRNDNNYAEWIQYRNGIEKNEYLNLLERFNWNEINPEEWVILAKESGMKYVVLTAKHHDGFALWDSKASNYNITEHTNPPRDILKELASACQKHGLRMGIYYSHWLDWEHEYGWDHSKEVTGITNEDYDRYWQDKVIPQMRELMSEYGPIDLVWFDMWIHHSRTVVSKEQLIQLKGLIRELQPNCLINSRLGLSIDEDSDVDFHEMGDNQIGNQMRDFPWQSPATVSHSWGFHRKDTDWKSTTSLLHSLINNVSLNGNYLLNIGPRANGEVPYEIEKRLHEIGKWLKVNGESIYGCKAFDLPKDLHDWGKITSKKTDTGTVLYLHLFNYPLGNQLFLDGVTSRPTRIYILADSLKRPLEYTHNGASTTIILPDHAPDPFVSVIALEYSGKPQISDGLVAKNMDGGYSLLPWNITGSRDPLKIINKQRGGTVPSHIVINEQTKLKWNIYVDEPCSKTIDVSYSYQGATERNTIVLRAAGKEISHKVSATGKTVGEPNSDWIIDNFKSHRLGTINFSKAGYYEIELEIKPEKNENIKFQWVWVN